MKRLLATITSKRDLTIFLTAYYHGLRASEVGLLQIADLDLKRRRIAIPRLKGSPSGVYPLHPDLVKLLRSYLRTRTDESPYLFISNRSLPISRYMLDRLIKTYCTAAGLTRKKCKFRSLRHSIATHLIDANADLRFVQDWLGYTNTGNPRIYAKLTNPTRDREARRVFASLRVV
jgi:integrase